MVFAEACAIYGMCGLQGHPYDAWVVKVRACAHLH